MDRLPEDVRLERAHAEDLNPVLDLLDRCGLPRDGVADHLSTVVVARRGPETVGCAGLELYIPAALLRSVAVAPHLRGHGLGRALTAQALDLARLRRVDRLYLLTETAADFFRRFGFRPVPREEVPPTVRGSVEFTTACPASALAMMLHLDLGRDPSPTT